jgi:DNA-binding response OmpR family regulator
MPDPASVLVFGRDDQLVHTRCLILEKAGFRVRTAASLPDLRQLLAEPSMDVMLLCHTLSPQECDEALNLTHQRWPLMQTIALSSGSSDCGSDAADAVIEVREGPAKLINTVRRHLN